jgi:LmbE family N-acetylglucosaminyl deacetylase
MLALPKSVLVIVAHQDDETIGCGGTIKRWSSMGSDVKVVVVTTGDTGIDYSGRYNSKNIEVIRNREIHQAKQILGWNTTQVLREKTQCVENNQHLFHKVIWLIRHYSPELVITHAPNDKHRDHRAVSEVVKEACWKASENIHPELGSTHRVRDLWAMEILDLLPKVDYIVDITDTYENKVEAMRAYNSQKEIISGIFNHIDGLAKVRGYAVGSKYGEAFMRLNTMPVVL